MPPLGRAHSLAEGSARFRQRTTSSAIVKRIGADPFQLSGQNVDADEIASACRRSDGRHRHDERHARPGPYEGHRQRREDRREAGRQLRDQRAPAHRPVRGQGRRGSSILTTAGVTRKSIEAAYEELRGDTRVTDQQTDKPSSRRWNSTARTSRRRRARASSTRSSAVPRRSAAPSRCCRAARRTTRCSSASPAPARPPSSRAWPSASWPAMCPRR